MGHRRAASPDREGAQAGVTQLAHQPPNVLPLSALFQLALTVCLRSSIPPPGTITLCASPSHAECSLAASLTVKGVTGAVPGRR